MIKNIITIAIRNIIKHKLYSAINVFGLTIGFTAFILISLFLQYEYSADAHNENYDRIYRVQQHVYLANKVETWTQTPPALADLIKDKYPEFEKIALAREAWGEFLSSSETQTFFEPEGYYADPSFFDIFSFNFIEGNSNALSEPFSIVLSKTLADKLYPKEAALGKTIVLEKKFNMKVTGVYTDLPENSHERPSYIIPFSSFSTIKNWNNYRTEWGTSFRTYVLIKNGPDVKKLNAKIAGFIKEHHKDQVTKKLYLHPLSKLYLQPEEKNDYMVAIAIYGLVALFILILSIINYVNLTTSNASLRIKEIAVRKVNGSNRWLLIKQFLGETVLMSFLAYILSLILSILLLPVFNIIVDRDIAFSFTLNWQFILAMACVSVITGLVSGIYPAFVLSSLKIFDLLKGNALRKLKGEVGPKKILVTFQYVISIFLIIVSIVIFQQVKYMLNKSLGFNKENLLYTSISSSREVNFEDLRNRILKHTEIIEATASLSIPFNGSNGWSMNWEGNNSDERMDVRYNEVSVDFIKTFGMKIIMGRDFSRSYTSDGNNACLINETACKRFGWTDPIGKTVDGKYMVIGVVENFHPYSVHNEIPPYLIKLKSDLIKGDHKYTFRVLPGKISEARKILTREFESYFPNDPFQFTVFTEHYKNDGAFKVWQSINNTILFFAILIILLAIIGIYGLVSFTTQQKTKEIGIRKVHGSSIGSIYLNLIKEFLILLFLAIFIAGPAAYYMYQFIPGAYKYGLYAWEYVLAISIVVVITLATTSYQIIKVSLTNPIKALRYE